MRIIGKETAFNTICDFNKSLNPKIVSKQTITTKIKAYLNFFNQVMEAY